MLRMILDISVYSSTITISMVVLLDYNHTEEIVVLSIPLLWAIHNCAWISHDYI